MLFNMSLGLMVVTVSIANLLIGDFYYLLVLLSLLLGIHLNKKVRSVNGGTMPVFSKNGYINYSATKSEWHHVGSENTNLPFLADIINTGVVGVWSVGDVLIMGSVLVSGKYVYDFTTAIF